MTCRLLGERGHPDEGRITQRSKRYDNNKRDKGNCPHVNKLSKVKCLAQKFNGEILPLIVFSLFAYFKVGFVSITFFRRVHIITLFNMVH